MTMKFDLKAELEAALDPEAAFEDEWVEDTADIPLAVEDEDLEDVVELEEGPVPDAPIFDTTAPAIDLSTLLGPASNTPTPDSRPSTLNTNAPTTESESDHNAAEPGSAKDAEQSTEVSPTVGRSGAWPALKQWFLGSNLAQLGTLGALGLVIVGIWTALDPAQTAPIPAQGAGPPTPGRFPSLEVEGRNDPISPSDVQRLLELRVRERAEAEAQAHPPPEAPSRPAPYVLRPGQIADPETGTIIEVGGDQDSGRGVIAGGGQERRPAGAGATRPGGGPRRGQWFSPGGVLEGVGASGASAEGGLPIVAGDRLEARLEVGIASTQHQTVVAKLTKDFKRDGQVILRRGDVLLGRSRNDDARVYIDLLKVRSAGREYGIQGYAVGGDLPGLTARRREATFEERSKARAVGGAVRGAAREVGDVLAEASVVGRVARGAAEGPADEASREVEVEVGFVLEVPAGRVFEVVIVGGGGRP